MLEPSVLSGFHARAINLIAPRLPGWHNTATGPIQKCRRLHLRSLWTTLTKRFTNALGLSHSTSLYMQDLRRARGFRTGHGPSPERIDAMIRSGRPCAHKRGLRRNWKQRRTLFGPIHLSRRPFNESRPTAQTIYGSLQDDAERSCGRKPIERFEQYARTLWTDEFARSQ